MHDGDGKPQPQSNQLQLSTQKLLPDASSIISSSGMDSLVFVWPHFEPLQDSIIYSHPIDNDPLKCGPHLGDFTDECLWKEIVEFVSAGCKHYALKLKSPNNPEAEYVLKIRGITLDYNTCNVLHYETFKQKVLDYGIDIEPIIVSYNMLRPCLKKGSVYSVPMQKKYWPIITKGVVNDCYQVVNFGTN